MDYDKQVFSGEGRHAFAVRPMEEGDLDRVLAIARELKETPYWTRAAYSEAMERRGVLKRVALVAVFWNQVYGDEERGNLGGIVGFLVGSVMTPDAELELIAVERELEGRGIGRALLVAYEAAVRQEGAEQILLEVRASNRRALKLYTGLGFVETGRRMKYYSNPVEDAILMKKHFSFTAI